MEKVNLARAAEDVATARYCLLSAWHRATNIERELKAGGRASVEPVRDRVLEATEALNRANRALDYADFPIRSGK